MKNLIIASVVGLLFMGGGFWYGLKLKPLPTPPTKEAAAATAQAAAVAAQPPISLDTLKKASESMMSLNDALKTREEKVAEREQAVKEKEDELAAERIALDNSHEKFKALFQEFQQRLQLVEANQVEQLQKEAELYEGMDIDQAIDLIRVKDDGSIARLFSVMETKPLGKLVAQWKVKYPQEGARVVAVLDGMAQVLPKDKIALSDTSPTTDSGSTTPPADASAPAADGSSPAPANATPDATAATATAPASDATTPQDSTAAPASAPTPAPDATPSTDPNAPANNNSAAPTAPPTDSTPTAAPASAPAATASN